MAEMTLAEKIAAMVAGQDTQVEGVSTASGEALQTTSKSGR